MYTFSQKDYNNSLEFRIQRGTEREMIIQPAFKLIKLLVIGRDFVEQLVETARNQLVVELESRQVAVIVRVFDNRGLVTDAVRVVRAQKANLSMILLPLRLHIPQVLAI